MMQMLADGGESIRQRINDSLAHDASLAPLLASIVASHSVVYAANGNVVSVTSSLNQPYIYKN